MVEKIADSNASSQRADFALTKA